MNCIFNNKKKAAEEHGFTPEDIQVGLAHCGDFDPVEWMVDNWNNMLDTVVTLVMRSRGSAGKFRVNCRKYPQASNAGRELEENNVGTLSRLEAKEALRKHRGNMWEAATECVERRQEKVRNCQSFSTAEPFYKCIIFPHKVHEIVWQRQLRARRYPDSPDHARGTSGQGLRRADQDGPTTHSPEGHWRI